MNPDAATRVRTYVHESWQSCPTSAEEVFLVDVETLLADLRDAEAIVYDLAEVDVVIDDDVEPIARRAREWVAQNPRAEAT